MVIKTIQAALVTFVFLLMVSCRIHNGQLTSAPTGHNYIYVAHIKGKSEAKYWFGIGGLKQNELIDQAKYNMSQSRPLHKNEAYANMALDMQKSYWLIFTKMEVFVSADIIFHSDNNNFRYSGDYAKYIGKDTLHEKRSKFIQQIIPANDPEKTETFFEEGEKVIDKNSKEYLIVTIGYSRISVKEVETGITKSVNEPLYKTKGNVKGNQVGNIFFNESGEKYEIIGLGLNEMLIIDKNGSVYVAPY